MLIVLFSKIKNHMNVCTFVLLGLMVHALLLQAALDIYFSSPIDYGMEPIRSTTDPPAKRVVFIVADGLRAETIFGNNDIAPNLWDIRKSRGSWGIAHTRVPTESRPGHVALFAGIYEDPAAILKGWKSNPVDFDSVVNQSTNAYCWGGPSVINMFNEDNQEHVYLHSYDPSWEDFGKNNTIALDQWVFDQLREFITAQENCAACMAKFRQSGNFIFLHLLGTDTAGHAFKPESDQYRDNIKFVDSYIPKIEKLIEDTFRDHATAYIFTSDHGMTNWGSHGSGSDHETQTPLIAWGAGIKVANRQKDVTQIDIAPLISALIGINYPINNLGRLPVDYIDTSRATWHEMMGANVLQLIETFNVKKHRLEKNALKFVPYRAFNDRELSSYVQFLQTISYLGDDDAHKIQIHDFMNFLIEGTEYYHNYYQLPILISVTIGTIEWILYLAVYNIRLRRPTQMPVQYNDHTELYKYIFSAFYIMIIIIMKAQELPLSYYCYFLFPIVMAQLLTYRLRYILAALKSLKIFGFWRFAGYVVMYACGLELLINSFQRRHTLSLVIFVIAVITVRSRTCTIMTSVAQKMLWMACCTVLATFPYMPVMKTNFHIFTYLFGFAIWWLVFATIIFENMAPHVSNKYIKWQFLLFKLAPIYTIAVQLDFIGPESPIKYIAWIWSIVPIILIPLSTTRIFTRLTSIFLGFGTYYLMVTTNFENFFLICYIMTLYTWVKVESRCFAYLCIVKKTFRSETKNDEEPTCDDFRRAFFFIVLVFCGFFGTGNIASLSSFDPMWVRCFLTVFQPFLMSALILVRIAVPFIFISCAYRAVNMFRNSNTPRMLCIVLLLSDIMLLVLLFDIKNVGSWLEIGMSLSHFLIMDFFVVMVLILYGVTYLLTTVQCYGDAGE